MSKQFALLMFTLIVTILTFSAVLEGPVVHAQVTTFMKSPFFGKKAVSAVFDHQYPIYDTEPLGVSGTVVHRDGQVWSLSLPEQEVCVGYSGHSGIDYTLNYDYVLATHNGQVTVADWYDSENRRYGLGLMVEIKTDDSVYKTLYGHLSSLLVQTNQRLKRGQVIAISGNSGNSTGPHLHFEVKRPNPSGNSNAFYPVNPYGWASTNPQIPNDPWVNYPVPNSRPASVNLWQDPPSINKYSTCTELMYDSGTTIPPSNDPPLEPNLTHPYHLVLDNLYPWFTTSGGPWSLETCNGPPECYGSSYRYVTQPNNGDDYATWKPRSSELLEGLYDIYAYIPQTHANAKVAYYEIYHNDDIHSAVIDQAQFNTVAYPRTWAYLGRYDFGMNTVEPQRIVVSHEGDPALTQEMAADAVVFVLVDGPPDINVPIAQGSDDAGRLPGDCSFGLEFPEVYLGHCNDGTAIVSGFRYSSVDIPASMPIKRAHLMFTVDGPYNQELDLRFYGEPNPFSPTFNFNPGYRPEDRPLTSASLSWYIPTTDAWFWYQHTPPNHRYSPNLGPIVQEIVNLPGWQQGNSALTFIVKPAPGFSGDEHRRVMAYERGHPQPPPPPPGFYSARLLVWYSCPGGPPCPQQ